MEKLTGLLAQLHKSRPLHVSYWTKDFLLTCKWESNLGGIIAFIVYTAGWLVHQNIINNNVKTEEITSQHEREADCISILSSRLFFSDLSNGWPVRRGFDDGNEDEVNQGYLQTSSWNRLPLLRLLPIRTCWFWDDGCDAVRLNRTYTFIVALWQQQQCNSSGKCDFLE